MDYDIDKLVEVKDTIAYPSEVNKQIYLLSFWKKDLPVVFGSFIYRMQKYAGDIDLLQNIAYEDRHTAITEFIKTLKKICRELGRYRYFSEFKCGFDPYFKKNNKAVEVSDIIGKLKNGIWSLPQNIKKTIFSMLNASIIDNDEYSKIMFILSNLNTFDVSETQNGYDYVFDMIRNKKILRWSKEEILQGYKILRGDKYLLSDAVQDKSMIKIDIIALINGRYTEITNMISLCEGYYDEKAKKIICYDNINIDSDTLHSIIGLKKDIEKTYYSNKFFSLLKCCKRMFATIKQIKNDIQPATYRNTLNRLSKILMGDNSALYQIISEFDTVLTLLKKYKGLPIKTISHQLDNLKNRLSNILLIDKVTLKALSVYIDQTLKILAKKNRLQFLKDVDMIKKELKNYSNYHTLLQMYNLGIVQPPSFFIPEDNMYLLKYRIIGKSPLDEYAEFEKFVELEAKKYAFNTATYF